MTEKRNNYYIQGTMARERKFDPERMKELQDDQELLIEEKMNSIMEEQRQGVDKDGKLKQGPYYNSLIRLQFLQNQNVA